jgi:hypothetical protein
MNGILITYLITIAVQLLLIGGVIGWWIGFHNAKSIYKKD